MASRRSKVSALIRHHVSFPHTHTSCLVEVLAKNGRRFNLWLVQNWLVKRERSFSNRLAKRGIWSNINCAHFLGLCTSVSCVIELLALCIPQNDSGLCHRFHRNIYELCDRPITIFVLFVIMLGIRKDVSLCLEMHLDELSLP